MTDKEQVKHKIEEELHLAEHWGEQSREVDVSLLERVLALLKEQEPAPVRYADGKKNHFIKCGSCNLDLMPDRKFCPRCGQAVKWE